MPETAPGRASGELLGRLMPIIEQHWGYRSLRPLQEQAMRAALAGRDSLLVLPTGGGKSLCYQAPAIVCGDTTVVVSPLISLMKDQVDGLRACGVSAVQLNSSMTADEQRRGEESVQSGAVRLLFLSPERLATTACRRLLAAVGVKRFAIDEAHCISHWGHDFRPDYRQLGELKRLFPGASVHAFTATATRKVRDDIVAQLGLDASEVLVGNFDRANLTYRVVRRGDVAAQALECLGRHRGESGIIYCIRRRDVEDLVAVLVAQGIRALAYHAGMTPPQRKRTQDAFREERCDVVVATVAFGMGIDRSNVRYVLHTGMPKSIEHYQQETGRAGRDGLEAECTLLYSPSDAITWQRMFDKSVAESEAPVDPQYVRSVEKHIAEMDAYCRRRRCRHRALVEYFDQAYAPENCEACDVCLGDALAVPDGHTIAKKVLSCVARLKEQYGASYVISVLRGDRSEVIHQRGHNQLSTYGLLAEHEKADLRDWIEQLIEQQVLVRTVVNEQYPIVQLNDASWEVMRDQRTAKLVSDRSTDGPEAGKSKRQRKRSRAETQSWQGVDRELFEKLREVRRTLADERGVPAFMVFADSTLRELARLRPLTPEQMLQVAGVGQAKLRDFGEAVLALIAEYCRARGDLTDARSSAAATRRERP